MQTNDASHASHSIELAELVQNLRAHLDSGVRLANQGLALASATEAAALQQFFERCVRALEQQRDDAPSVAAPPRDVSAVEAAPSEQVSAATFASGDGADDAQVTPEGARGKAGNWPAY